jgi:hypothetical protein
MDKKMRYKTIFLEMLLAAQLGFFLQPANAQIIAPKGVWATNGPIFNAEVTGILVDPDDRFNILLGTRGGTPNVLTGLFFSQNGGIDWVPADPPLDDVNVEAVFRVDSMVFVSAFDFNDASNTGLYFSADFGQNWERATDGAGNGLGVLALSMISFGGTIYTATARLPGQTGSEGGPGGIYTSADGGRSWNLQTGTESMPVVVLLEANGQIFAGTGTRWKNRFPGDAWIAQGIFFSNDGGATWQQHLTGGDIETLLSAGEKVFAGTKANGLFTFDEGLWLRAAPPLDFGRVRSITTVFQQSDSLLFAARDKTVYKSTDTGESWTEFITVQKPVSIVHSDKNPEDPFIFVGTEGDGVYQGAPDSSNTDPGFEMALDHAEAPMDESTVTMLASDREGRDTFAGTFALGVFRAPNGSPAWFPTASYGTFPPLLGVIVAEERTVIAFGAGVYRSTDAGLRWQAADTSMNRSGGNAVQTILHDPENLNFVLGKRSVGQNPADLGVWVSKDAITWKQTQLRNVSVSTLIQTFNPDVFEDYFAGTDGGIYRFVHDEDKKTEETEWIHVLPLDQSRRVGTLLEAPGIGIFAGVSGRGSSNEDGVYFSADGEDWTQATGEIQGIGVTALFEQDSTVYAGTNGRGIYYSSDGGASWQKAEVPFTDESNAIISAFAYAPNEGYIVAGSGSNPAIDADNQGIFRSEDGIEWFPAAPEALDNVAMNDKDIRTLIEIDGLLYAGTDGDGVFRSIDGGVSWTPLNTEENRGDLVELTDKHTRNLQYLKVIDHLFVSTLGGVFAQGLDTEAPDISRLFYIDIEPDLSRDELKNIDFEYGFTKTENIQYVLVDDGNFAADSMRISEDSTFRDVNWKSFEEADKYTLSPEDGDKTVYMQFKDFAFNLSETIEEPITLDKTLPQFAPHTPPSDARVGEPVTVSFAVTEKNIASITFRLRRPGQPWDPRRSFFFFDDTDGPDGIEIDGGFITSSGLDYRIIVTDKAGNSDSLKNNALTFFSLPVNLNPGELGNSRSLPAGTGGKGYRMVSAPMDLQGAPLAKDVFKDLGKYGKRGKWLFYAYQGNGKWQDGENVPVQTGAGYFMIRRDGKSLTNKLAGTTTPTADGITGNIPGWHLRANDWTLIGNPYNTRISLGQLMLKSDSTRLNDESIAGQIWLYDGDWKNPKTKPDIALETWGGLFVRASRADTIVFASAADPFKAATGKAAVAPDGFSERTGKVSLRSSGNASLDEKMKRELNSPPNRGANQRKISATLQNVVGGYNPQFIDPAGIPTHSEPAEQHEAFGLQNAGGTFKDTLKRELQTGEWLVQIIATRRDFADEANYFGVRKDAEEGLDKHDWFEPPFLPDGVGLAFPHADWEPPADLTADFRPAGGDGLRWDFEVRGASTYAVQLDFKNLGNVPEKFHILLVDEATQIARDLRKQSQHSFRIPDGANAKALSLLVGDDFFINEQTDGLLGVPEAFALHQNYPNPFNPSTTIRYALPVSGKVTLKIFDLMGHEVLTLEDETEHEAGYYEVVADMRGLSSGMYFYRIAVEGAQRFQAVKKMVYVK